MALKDSWHRTLVYFGLAEEYDDDDYDPETGPEVALEDRYRERPNVRRLAPRRRPDDIDDIFGEDQPRGGRQQTVLRSVQGGRGGNGGATAAATTATSRSTSCIRSRSTTRNRSPTSSSVTFP
jgi:hypothetical protein